MKRFAVMTFLKEVEDGVRLMRRLLRMTPVGAGATLIVNTKEARKKDYLCSD